MVLPLLLSAALLATAARAAPWLAPEPEPPRLHEEAEHSGGSAAGVAEEHSVEVGVWGYAEGSHEDFYHNYLLGDHPARPPLASPSSSPPLPRRRTTTRESDAEEEDDGNNNNHNAPSHRRRLATPTGIRTFANDYLFADQREFLCAGVNILRESYTTVEYTGLNTTSEREYCATNGTELKTDIESGPDLMHVVLPRGREIRLDADAPYSPGAILIREGQTVHLRANNGSTSISAGNASRIFVVHGTLIAQDIVFRDGNSALTAGATWTTPPIRLPAGDSGGAIHLAQGRARAHLVRCTFYGNNVGSIHDGRDIFNEGELVLHEPSFAPAWVSAPAPIHNAGTLQVTPSELWDTAGVSLRL